MVPVPSPYGISLSAQGPWVELSYDDETPYTTREEALEDAANHFDPDNTEPHMYVRHPDGRVEEVDYYGGHVTWT